MEKPLERVRAGKNPQGTISLAGPRNDTRFIQVAGKYCEFKMLLPD